MMVLSKAVTESTVFVPLSVPIWTSAARDWEVAAFQGFSWNTKAPAKVYGQLCVFIENMKRQTDIISMHTLPINVVTCNEPDKPVVIVRVSSVSRIANGETDRDAVVGKATGRHD